MLSPAEIQQFNERLAWFLEEVIGPDDGRSVAERKHRIAAGTVALLTENRWCPPIIDAATYLPFIDSRDDDEDVYAMSFYYPYADFDTPLRAAKPTFTGTPADGLIEAGRQFPGAEVAHCPRHPLLEELSRKHAEYMASRRRQGHQQFAARMKAAMKEFGATVRCSEIAAQSWPWQFDEDYVTLGAEMFKCWKFSKGHWSVASKRHDWIGAGMAMGRNRLWYATIMTVDEKK